MSSVGSVLKNYGFKPVADDVLGPPSFIGKLKTDRGDLEAILVVPHGKALPSISLTSSGRKQLERDVFPHVTTTGNICVFEEAIEDFDPYLRPALVVSVIEKAVKLLSVQCETEIEDELSRDLANHFYGVLTEVDAPLKDGYLEVERIGDPVVTRLIQYKGGEIAGLLVITERLSFKKDQSLPTNFKSFLEWLKYWDKNAFHRAVEKIEKLEHHPDRFVLMLASPGGLVGMQYSLGTLNPKQQKFKKKRPISSVILKGIDASTSRDRVLGRHAYLPEMLYRNGRTGGQLSGKTIWLIGCGSIGGHLAPLLIQQGAGMNKGRLILVDHDILSTANTIRHRLGKESIFQNKAIAMKRHCEGLFPDANVEYVAKKNAVILNEVNPDHIIIDATGEQSVREDLNSWWLAYEDSDSGKPLMQHCWIEGNGIGGISFFNMAPIGACARCVRSAYYGDQDRLQFTSESTEHDGVVCGVDAYTPYGPQAAVMTAGLACQHLVETELYIEDPKSLPDPKALQTVRVSFQLTNQVKPKTMRPLANCPACKKYQK